MDGVGPILPPRGAGNHSDFRPAVEIRNRNRQNHAIRCAQEMTIYVRWIQEGFKEGFLQKHLNPMRVPFLGDAVRILWVCTAVTLTFGL